MPPAAKSKSPAHLPVAFWDASALVPLCCWQIQTKAARQARRLFPQMVVWWWIVLPVRALRWRWRLS